MTKIIIADDHALVREGLRLIFSRTDDISVVGEAADGSEVLELLQKAPCNVLLLDMQMPGINGIELIKRIKQDRPFLPILVLSICDDSDQALRALKAGAAGYATKGSEPKVLIAAIKKVAGGERYVTPCLAEEIALKVSVSDERPGHENLSKRELQVLHLLISGKQITDVAIELSLSAKTVSTHKSRLMDKLGVQNNADLIRYCIRYNLFEQGRIPPQALRQHAEASLGENALQSAENLDALTPEEMRRMLHELHVHQIELEMQNEELRRAQLELDNSRARYFDLYDLAPVGYCTVSEQGLIQQANLTAAAMLGIARDILVNQPFSRYIFEKDTDIYHLFCKRIIKTGEASACELRMAKHDGTKFRTKLEANIAPTNGAQALHIVLSNIAEPQLGEEL